MRFLPLRFLPVSWALMPSGRPVIQWFQAQANASLKPWEVSENWIKFEKYPNQYPTDHLGKRLRWSAFWFRKLNFLSLQRLGEELDVRRSQSFVSPGQRTRRLSTNRRSQVGQKGKIPQKEPPESRKFDSVQNRQHRFRRFHNYQELSTWGCNLQPRLLRFPWIPMDVASIRACAQQQRWQNALLLLHQNLHRKDLPIAAGARKCQTHGFWNGLRRGWV